MGTQGLHLGGSRSSTILGSVMVAKLFVLSSSSLTILLYCSIHSLIQSLLCAAKCSSLGLVSSRSLVSAVCFFFTNRLLVLRRWLERLRRMLILRTQRFKYSKRQSSMNKITPANPDEDTKVSPSFTSMRFVEFPFDVDQGKEQSLSKLIYFKCESNDKFLQSTMLAQHLRKTLFLFSRRQDVLGTALTTMKVKKNKRGDQQLSQLKRALIAKEPVKSESLYEEFHHRDIYNRIDTDIESFFFKRAYTVDNFNFLINLLGHQMKKDQIPEVLAKMELLQIEPDDKTYNYMIKAAAVDGDVKLAEKYFEEGVERFGDSKFFYTSLMQAYVKNNTPEMAYKILQEMVEKGIQPDLPVYTTVVNCFRIGRKLEKCWEINKMLVAKKVELDETYVGVMLKVHAATHDAEKAVKLYQQTIVRKGIKPMLETTNSYFKALSSRVDYAPRVVDMFFNMIETGDIINHETVKWALKAASANGNVKSAIQIVKIMKLSNIQPDKQIYNSLIRVYANACQIPDLSDSHRDMILTDTWKILEEVINKNMLDTVILNNVMLTYANSLQQDKIEGLILPLYEKFNLEMDPYTYEILVDMNYKKKDFNTALRVWETMKVKLQEKKQKQIQKHGFYKANLETMREDLRPTFNMLELYIQMGIRLMDMRMVLEALETFKKLKRHPKNSTLKFLGNLKNLPIEIQVSLMDFNIRFGAAKLAKTRTHGQKNVKDPQDL